MYIFSPIAIVGRPTVSYEIPRDPIPKCTGESIQLEHQWSLIPLNSSYAVNFCSTKWSTVTNLRDRSDPQRNRKRTLEVRINSRFYWHCFVPSCHLANHFQTGKLAKPGSVNCSCQWGDKADADGDVDVLMSSTYDTLSQEQVEEENIYPYITSLQ